MLQVLHLLKRASRFPTIQKADKFYYMNWDIHWDCRIHSVRLIKLVQITKT